MPFAYSKFHFIYLPDRLVDGFLSFVKPNFICFNPKECPVFTKSAVDIVLNNGLTCCPSSELTNKSSFIINKVGAAVEKLFVRCTTTGIEESCSHRSLFHCPVSMKCISKHRLLDGISDCYFGEDESFPTCQLNDSQGFICESERNKCLSPIALNNGNNDCKGKEDEIIENGLTILKENIPFGLLCDNQNHPLLVESNETDETNCEHWPCNNPYVRCNSFRNCANGTDGLNCPKLKCQSNDVQCPKTLLTNMFCIPLMILMRKYLNCEVIYTEHDKSSNTTINKNTIECFSHDTQCTSSGEMCYYLRVQQRSIGACFIFNEYFCQAQRPYWAPLIKGNICPFLRQVLRRKELEKSFLISSQLGKFPENSTILSHRDNFKIKKETVITPQNNTKESWYCNRGVFVYFNDNKTKKCLCPPSYFDERCQWQNQRVSLTVQLVRRAHTYTIAAFQIQ
ncbi:unnamed protein product [Rotaria sp. Silwood2]|nr:unnamed protein product [Rotaria sp. Silwood2]